MEPAVLNDPAIYPTEEILASHMGSSMAAFTALIEGNRSSHPDFTETWKYYNDGKRWLFNVSRKKKTLFWLSVCQGFFRITFYFNAKADKTVIDSSLPEYIKAMYRESAGKTFRSITLVIKDIKDIEPYGDLLNIKLRVH